MKSLKSIVSQSKVRRAAAVAALALGIAATSSAFAGTTTVEIQSNPSTTKRKLGSYTGTASYDDATGLLTVTLNNTSAADKAGRLTGVAFNMAGTTTKARYVDGDNTTTPVDEDAFDDARNKKGVVKAKPFGNYDGGAALNGKWGKGSAKAAAAGIAAGGSQSFVFDIDNAAAGMTASDFFTGNSGIAVAFRGKKADKVGGVVTPVSPSEPVIPGPVIDIPDDNEGGIIAPPVVIPPNGGNGNGTGTGGNTDGGTGGNTGGGDIGQPAAVPLPPAVWTGFAGLAAMMTPKLKKKLRKLL
jgi:hypothetical protein